MDERSDSQLLADVAVDPIALETVYRRHVGRVPGFGARRLTRPEDVADFRARAPASKAQTADSQVHITLDDAPLGSIPSRADGTFNDHLDLPSSVVLGEHTITASTGETAATTTVTIIR